MMFSVVDSVQQGAKLTAAEMPGLEGWQGYVKARYKPLGPMTVESVQIDRIPPRRPTKPIRR